MRNACLIESPKRADLGEGKIVLIAKREPRGFQPRKPAPVRQAILGGLHLAQSGQALEGVAVLNIMRISRGDQQVFVAIEVYIQKDAAPGPISRIHPAQLRDLGKRRVAPIEAKRVAWHGRSKINVKERNVHLLFQNIFALAMPRFVMTAQHFGHKKIVVSIAIDVREVDRHRRQTHVAQSGSRNGSKSPAFFVDPDPIRPMVKIVTDVDIGEMVSIDISKHNREAPIGGRRF